MNLFMHVLSEACSEFEIAGGTPVYEPFRISPMTCCNRIDAPGIVVRYDSCNYLVPTLCEIQVVICYRFSMTKISDEDRIIKCPNVRAGNYRRFIEITIIYMEVPNRRARVGQQILISRKEIKTNVMTGVCLKLHAGILCCRVGEGPLVKDLPVLVGIHSR